MKRLYWLIRHLPPAEAGSGGTMIGCGSHETTSDEKALRHFCTEHDISPDRLTTNQNENREFSVVRLVRPL